jgi:hypothetical protein
MPDRAHVHGSRRARTRTAQGRPGSRGAVSPVIKAMGNHQVHGRFWATPNRAPCGSERLLAAGATDTRSTPLIDGEHAARRAIDLAKSTRNEAVVQPRTMTLELRPGHLAEMTLPPVAGPGLSRRHPGRHCGRVKATPPSRWFYCHDRSRATQCRSAVIGRAQPRAHVTFETARARPSSWAGALTLRARPPPR